MVVLKVKTLCLEVSGIKNEYQSDITLQRAEWVFKVAWACSNQF